MNVFRSVDSSRERTWASALHPLAARPEWWSGPDGRSGRNFVRFHHVGGTTTRSSWSDIQGLVGQDEEVKLATVKSSGNGFLEGETYFSSPTAGRVGRIAPDGQSYNLTWATLPGVSEPVRGLYRDQSGVFGGDLIVVTSHNLESSTPKTIWRINSAGNATQLASINAQHLEGVITLPNDINKWGILAGKIVTGDEYSHLIYTVGGGAVNPYDLNINPEDFDTVPEDQHLYCTVPSGIVKIHKNFLADFVGNLLIT